ncbi:MAG: hypothetical protein ACRDJP_04400 [Actinomycetota bacterium]
MQINVNGRMIGRILVGILLGAAIGWLVWISIRPEPPFDGTVDPDRFQAVFLENDRVYFGHLEEAGDDFYLLTDAFFIEEMPAQTEDQPPVREVVSVREEFQGPDDEMLVAIEDVVLIQNLRPDSEVAEAIERVLAQD